MQRNDLFPLGVEYYDVSVTAYSNGTFFWKQAEDLSR